MGDIYEANWQISVDGVVSTINQHYEQDLGGDSPTISQSAANAIQAQCLVNLQGVLATDARVESLYVRKLTGITRPAWKGNFVQAIGTGLGPDAISAQNCLLINLRNSAGLLKRSGRWFVSGCPKVSVVNGIWAGAFLDGPVDTWTTSTLNIPAGGDDGWSGALRVMRTVIDGEEQDPPVPVIVDSI
ncbi:unnamed protein product, partial [marine sediment metagenome]